MQSWTAPVFTRFRALLRTGCSYGKVAELLSREFKIPLTRNACIGMANRRNMLKGRPPTKYTLHPELRNKPQLGVPIVKRKHRKVEPTQPLGTYLLEDLPANGCRWPSGERVPYFFCGDEQLEGCSYCEAHNIIATGQRK